MHVPTLTSALLALLATTASATKIISYSGTSCKSGDQVTWTGHSVNCEKLANVRSFEVFNVDSGCSVTYYSDSECSNDATRATAGSCFGYSSGGKVRSWSWDC
ncbi:hypothetical protein BU16DRAFT_560753 [Lophium mytilinum]|uniref:Uncharacterized protein n=1 Tax=Lophium mytilinum TaxID=390894 RepID=A0A6A6QUU9_9PEZI|nr:hypothetical protein BU16DRAFT_560753 [Lophium mytilinum]